MSAATRICIGCGGWTSAKSGLCNKCFRCHPAALDGCVRDEIYALEDAGYFVHNGWGEYDDFEITGRQALDMAEAREQNE